MAWKNWKKTLGIKKFSRVIQTARARRAKRAHKWISKPAFAGAVMCVAAAALIAAYASSNWTYDANENTVAAGTNLASAGMIDAHAEIKPESKVEKPVAQPAPAKALAPRPPAAAEPRAAAAAPVEAGSAPRQAQVSITGCLEQSDERFRLKDASGDNVPRSRSWKSGFLKKGSASIAVVDSAKRVNLSDHVGQRVTVTGTLIDREMQVRSLQRIAASCAPTQRAKI